MHTTGRKGRWGRLLAATGLIAGFAMGGAALLAESSGAQQQGTLSCPNFNDQDAGNPGPGMTNYLFIGTSTSDPTVTVSYTTLDGMSHTQDFPGTQQGNGSFHYIVSLPQGAVVTAATVTPGGPGQTVVTVSGCLNGPPAPPTTTGATSVTPPGGTTAVSPQTVSRPPTAVAPSAVVASPRLTG